jgi:4-aminobutyrate aminotransferase / (S)-3-amino-2-methylpropionate transaminase / 5-aminovalerate transaminase
MSDPAVLTASQSSIRLVTEVPGPRSRELVHRRNANVPRALGMTLPIFIERAEGALLEDVDGNVFLDFVGGIGCQNSGHRPAETVAAIKEQADHLLHSCFMVTPYEGYVEVAEWLNRNTPGDYAKKTFLANSGAEAVENAIKIARTYTKRPAIIAFEDAFHGRTQLAMTLTGKTHPYKSGFGPMAPEIYRMPYAYCYRCSYNLTHPSCKSHCAEQLHSMFVRHIEAESVAAVIFEPVQGEGGFIVPPADWFETIARICRKNGTLIIADEVQTGFCRTGAKFACDRFGLEPDLVVTAKSIAAGMPLAAVTGRAEIMDAPLPGGLGGTFGGNPVSCAAALSVMKIVDETNLAGKAEAIGSQFEERTRDWKTRFSLIGDIRGVGAMRAIELVKNRETKEPATEQTKQVLSLCHKSGLVIISAGTFANVLRILVPLVATPNQIAEGLSIIQEALTQADR